MKKKLILKESVMDNLIDINLIMVIALIISKFTLFVIPALVLGIIDFLVIIIYGGLLPWIF